MKLNRIQVQSFLGAHDIDVRLTTPVTLFTGPNGAAKSSIGEAVRMAITGDVVRVKLKKEYGQLVTDGATAGGAVITLDDDRAYAFNVPSGERTVDDGLPHGESVDIALNGQHFAAMPEDDRRTFLFKLSGAKGSAAVVKERMLARGCDLGKVEAVLPLLRTGFPDAAEYAAKKATEAKGAWRVATGKTYGPKQAEGWKAELPEQLATKPGSAADLAALDASIADLNQQIGTVVAEARTRQDAAAKRTALETQANSVKRVTDSLDHARKELAAYEPQVVALRERASGTGRVGLVHDMAAFIAAADFSTSDFDSEANRLLDRYEDEHGELTEAGAVDVEAKNSLPEYERGLEVMQNAVKNLERDLLAATTAKAQFDALAPAAEEEPLADLDQLKASLAAKRQAHKLLQDEITAAQVYEDKVTAANAKTTEAAGYHADVIAWLLVATALAPDGIPGELLADALAPINASFQEAASMTGWQQVHIAADMEITAGGRSYRLLSESEKWRVDAMIAVTVARLSGLKVLMLDRVDVLDLRGRAALLAWVNALVLDGDIETALLFATLKALPAALYPTMTAHWVAGGNIGAFKEAA